MYSNTHESYDTTRRHSTKLIRVRVRLQKHSSVNYEYWNTAIPLILE